MFILKHKNFFFALSGILVVGGLISLAWFGLPYGIDFTGGALMEVRYAGTAPSAQAAGDALKPFNLGEVSVQSTDNNGLIIRFKEVDEDTHQKISAAMRALDTTAAVIAPDTTKSVVPVQSPQAKKPAIGITATDAQGNVINLGQGITVETASPVIKPEQVSVSQTSFEELRFESIGPSVGKTLKQRAKWAIVLATILIILFVGWSFRHVSKPVASWKYGLLTIVALIHDLAIPMGVFAILGYFGKVEISAAFVAAMLTILGYSVNDTIVVLDRVRENLLRDKGDTFAETVGISLDQTYLRSFFTSFTTLLALTAVYIFGGQTIQPFALALIIGIAAGTYSSIFIASPLLVVIEEGQRKSNSSASDRPSRDG